MMNHEKVQGYTVSFRLLTESEELYDQGFRAYWEVNDERGYRERYGVEESYVLAFAKATHALTELSK